MAVAGLELLVLLLQILDLRTQGQDFLSQLGDLVEQVHVGAGVVRARFERGHAVGETRPLRERGRGGHEGRRERNWNHQPVTHRLHQRAV